MAKVSVGPMISRDSESHSGHGAGAGTIDTTVYMCPCGKGTYKIVKDNIPGFRDKDYYLECDECNKNYKFDPITGDIIE